MTSSGKGLETDQRIREALSSFGGSCSPGELYAATAIPQRTVRAGLDRMAKAGEITRTNSRIEFTLAGRANAAPAAPELPWNALDVASTELLPQWQAAFARLLADAVVVRSLLPDRRLQPGFVAFGPPKTAKSTTVAFVTRALGIVDSSEEVLLDSLARGELLGRRVAGEGGRQVFEPSPLMNLRLLCLDEFTNADSELRRESRKLLQGDPELLIEGTKVRIGPTVVVLFNPQGKVSPLDVLRPAIHRRSITLNTATVGQALCLFDGATDEFYRSPPSPLVDLGRLSLRHQEMPRDASGLLRSAAQDDGPLEEAGREIWDAPKLELCALGRAARWGVGESDDLRGAAAGVLIDALTCAETVAGWVLPNWRDGIAANEGAYRKWLGESRGGSEILARVDRGRLERLGAEATAVVARRQATTADLETHRFRAELVESLAQASRSIERVPERYRVRARGIREVTKRLRERVGDVRSMADLVELAELARPTIVEADELRSRIQLERDQEARNAQAEKDRETERRRAEAQIKAQARQTTAQAARQRKAQLSNLQTMRRALVRLRSRRKATSPTEVLDKLIEFRVVAHYFEDRTEELPINPIDELIAKFRKRETVPVHRALRYRWVETLDGRRWPETAFGQWTDSGPQAALDMAIAEIDRHIGLVRSGAVGLAPIPFVALSAGTR